jgi:hypothetical protein
MSTIRPCQLRIGNQIGVEDQKVVQSIKAHMVSLLSSCGKGRRSIVSPEQTRAAGV